MAEQKEEMIYFKEQVVVPNEERDFVVNNPEGLTIEGVKFNIKQWTTNRYVKGKYTLMLNNCKNFTKSGKLPNGKTVLSRDSEGNVTWSEMIDENFNLVQNLVEVKQ